jgi:eIF-2B alpha/beta/delta-like uncharacterized protein
MRAMNNSLDIDRLIAEIRQDRTHGAAELARSALQIMKIAVAKSQASHEQEFKLEMDEIGRRLMSARPSMASVGNVVGCLLQAVSQHSGTAADPLRKFAVAKADELIQASLKAAYQIAQRTVSLVADNELILTHSYSSTVLAALKLAGARHSIRVTVTRSGAGRTGEETARQLSSAGVPVTFIDDTAIGLFLPQSGKVMVGADRVCADGGLVNGVGTSLLALLAYRRGVPFYVLCENLKIDPAVESAAVELEEKGLAELAAPGVLPEGVIVRNLCFDITPLEMITGFITEDGLIIQNEILAYIRDLRLRLGSI